MSAVAGRVLLIGKGVYSASVTYNPLDWVTYGHSSYCCKATTIGNLPTDTNYWQPMAQGVETPAEIGIGIGTCSTAASTAAKTATLNNYELLVNGIVAVSFTNAVPANATLNINSQGAKPIYYQGAAIVDQVIRAGYTATFAYDGTNYVLLSVDKSAGHEIKNPSGTTMTQRSALMFEGGVEVTDDSTNDQTKIKVNGKTLKDQDGTSMTHRGNVQFVDAFVSDDSTNNATVVENIKEHSTKADYDQATEDGFHVCDDGNDAEIGASSDDYVEVTTDGTKTIGTMLNELFNLIDLSKLSNSSVLIWYQGSLTLSQVFQISSILPDKYTFTMLENDTTTGSVAGICSRIIVLKETNSYWRNVIVDDTYQDVTNIVVGSDRKITLYYGNKKAVVDLQTTANRCLLNSGVTVESVFTETVGGAEHIVGSIDGKNVYQRRVNISLTAGTRATYDFPSGYNRYWVSNEDSFIATSARGSLPINFSFSSYYVSAYMENNQLRVESNQWSGECWVNVRYIKS